MWDACTKQLIAFSQKNSAIFFGNEVAIHVDTIISITIHVTLFWYVCVRRFIIIIYYNIIFKIIYIIIYYNFFYKILSKILSKMYNTKEIFKTFKVLGD